MVSLSTLLRYWQESKSNKAAESLKAMVTNTAMVLRHNVNTQDQILIKQRYGVEVKQLKVFNLKYRFSIWCLAILFYFQLAI